MAQHQHREHTFKYLKRVENTIVLSETTPTEVYETKKVLNSKRSTDLFEISKVILKTVDPAVCEILCDVFNKFFKFHVISWNTKNG